MQKCDNHRTDVMDTDALFLVFYHALSQEFVNHVRMRIVPEQYRNIILWLPKPLSAKYGAASLQYQPIAEPEDLGNGGRVKWVAGRAGEAPAYAGTDFIVARDGRIAALYLFFDKLP